MELVTLDKKGQVAIPRSVLKRLGIEREVALSVEVTPDGAILLRQADRYPLEIYSDKRIKEFAEADRMTAEEAKKLRARRK